MKFEEAMKCMREGKKVKEKDSTIYYSIEDGRIYITLKNHLEEVHTEQAIVINWNNIMSEDWEMFEDDNK